MSFPPAHPPFPHSAQPADERPEERSGPVRILGMQDQAFHQLVARLATAGESARAPHSVEKGRKTAPPRDVRFGLAFSGGSTAAAGAGAHELILDWARAADRAGLASLWLPERHF